MGNRDSVISPNGTTSGYQYDNLNRLTRVRHYKAGTILAHYAYTLNAAGIRMQVTEKDSSKVFYGYDSLYRLKSERRTGSHTDTMTYSYDPVGNRLTKAHRGVTTNYAYNNRDQLLSEWNGTDSTLYAYDSAGRMLTKAEAGGTTHYRWRDEDRLDSLYGPGVSVKYQYDADGRRVKDSTGSAVRQYLVDQLLPYGQVIAETDGSNSLVAEYTYGTDRVSLRRSGAAHYYLADGQGSTQLLTDSTGTATDSTLYTAFGETLFSSGSTSNTFLYDGEQFDGSAGLYNLRARLMDPKTGRFASIDASEGREKEPLTLHRYLYAGVSPISFRDPSGNEFSLTAETMALAGFGILTAATFINLQQGHSISNFAAPNLSVSIAMHEFWDAATSVSQGFETEAAVLMSELGTRTKDAIDKIKDLNKWQLILQMPTEMQRTAKTYTNLPYVQLEYGGDKGRVMGARLKNKSTGANNLIMRIDYHPVEKYFPGYDKTLHYHIPPDEDIHYFVWPDHVVLP